MHTNTSNKDSFDSPNFIGELDELSARMTSESDESESESVAIKIKLKPSNNLFVE